MRMAREFFKPRGEGVYLHVYNHTVTMMNDHLPLCDTEKEKFIQIFEKYKVKYNIEIISLVIMGNHFHALVYCPEKKFTKDEAFIAYNAFHKKEKAKYKDDFRVQGLLKNSNNISEFMRETQREFTLWFNKNRPYKRKGALWQDRFQCQLIQSDVYLWACLKYIEMNPVRAGICQKAEDYLYSSFGRWKEHHPYQQNFIEHILSLATEKTSLQEFKEYMSTQMKIMRIIDQADLLITKGEVKMAKRIREKVRQVRTQQQELLFLFEEKQWHGQKVIGSKDFIKEKYRQWDQYKDSA